jgi:large-conductance mechanosensitive channel
MKRSTFDALLSFLGGVSWAFVIVGAWVTFQSFVFLGIIPALMFTFLFIFLAVFLLLVLETMSMARDRNDILAKQNQLLEEIRDTVKAPSENTPQE